MPSERLVSALDCLAWIITETSYSGWMFGATGIHYRSYQIRFDVSARHPLRRSLKPAGNHAAAKPLQLWMTAKTLGV